MHSRRPRSRVREVTSPALVSHRRSGTLEGRWDNFGVMVERLDRVVSITIWDGFTVKDFVLRQDDYRIPKMIV